MKFTEKPTDEEIARKLREELEREDELLARQMQDAEFNSPHQPYYNAAKVVNRAKVTNENHLPNNYFTLEERVIYDGDDCLSDTSFNISKYIEIYNTIWEWYHYLQLCSVPKNEIPSKIAEITELSNDFINKVLGYNEGKNHNSEVSTPSPNNNFLDSYYKGLQDKLEENFTNNAKATRPTPSSPSKTNHPRDNSFMRNPKKLKLNNYNEKFPNEAEDVIYIDDTDLIDFNSINSPTSQKSIKTNAKSKKLLLPKPEIPQALALAADKITDKEAEEITSKELEEICPVYNDHENAPSELEFNIYTLSQLLVFQVTKDVYIHSFRTEFNMEYEEVMQVIDKVKSFISQNVTNQLKTLEQNKDLDKPDSTKLEELNLDYHELNYPNNDNSNYHLNYKNYCSSDLWLN
jgi:hypothetical protein